MISAIENTLVKIEMSRKANTIKVVYHNNRLVSQMRAPLAACREPAGKLW